MIIPGLGMLMSINDPKWGKGDGNSNNNGGRRPDDQGPPDLDELWNDIKRRLEGLWGGKGTNRPANHRNANRSNNDGGNYGNGGGGSGGGESAPPDPAAFARVVAIIAPLFVILWLASGFYIVEASERGLVLRFGEYVRKTEPGLQWRLPYPLESHEIVNLSGVRELTIGYQGSSKVPKEALMLTQDGNIIDIQFAVQYKLKDPVAFLFQNRMPEDAVKQVAESVAREIVGTSNFDDVISTGRTEVADKVKVLMQKILDDYQTGILIDKVNIQNAQPPEQVQDAFADAVKAAQDKEKAENDGKAYQNEVVPKAEGTAARVLAEAETYKARMVAAAEGDANRFTQILNEYSKAPEVTRQRLYLETMQQVYANTSKVMIDAKGQGNLLYLPLDKLIQVGGGAAVVQEQSGNVPPSTTGAATPAVGVDNSIPRFSRDPGRERESR
ncbi:MAG: FtsH protease activity modulator HflK [Zoogloeaceae bacterium]|jgi:membrane protease subunit HflK|nr:FtsH protease activity modulator HflK [Zoogloeaceae bacterium]